MVDNANLEELLDTKEDVYPSLPKEKWIGPLYLCRFNGCWVRPSNVEGVRKVLEQFKPLPTDVILASFPKTGTTWLKSLLHSIVNFSSKDSLISTHPHELVPFLELQLYSPHPPPFPDQTKRRILATHIPYEIFEPIHLSDCKVVYVTRNPKDVLISLWQFVKKSKLVDAVGLWPLDVAVEKFCKGVVPFGPYYEHVLGYKKESLKTPEKIFFTTYEELHHDTFGQVKKLADFLGCGLEKEEDVEEIVKTCSIEKLMGHEVNKSDDAPEWLELPYNSFRKGKVGDHKNYLEPIMIEKIDALTREKFHRTGFLYGI